jgi:hypothetical protein
MMMSSMLLLLVAVMMVSGEEDAKYSEADVIPLELLPPMTVSELLSWRQETHQVEAATFAKAGDVRVFGVDMSALCNASVCYSHHWTLFARVVPSPKAFLAADADVVRFVTSLDDAVVTNQSIALGSFSGRTAQIAPFELEARPYYVVVRTPRDGEFAERMPTACTMPPFTSLSRSSRRSSSPPTPPPSASSRSIGPTLA